MRKSQIQAQANQMMGDSDSDDTVRPVAAASPGGTASPVIKLSSPEYDVLTHLSPPVQRTDLHNAKHDQNIIFRGATDGTKFLLQSREVLGARLGVTVDGKLDLGYGAGQSHALPAGDCTERLLHSVQLLCVFTSVGTLGTDHCVTEA